MAGGWTYGMNGGTAVGMRSGAPGSALWELQGPKFWCHMSQSHGRGAGGDEEGQVGWRLGLHGVHERPGLQGA